MKRLIATSLVLLATTFLAAKADYILFLVDSYNAEGDTSLNFAYARLGVAYQGEAKWGSGGEQVYLTIGTTGKDIVFPLETSETYVHTGETSAKVLTEYESDDYTFYVETYDENDKVLWTYDETTARSYAELKQDSHIIYGDDPDIMLAPYATAWNVPEPTSGVLLLVGLAGLALKRRRAAAA